MDPSIIKTVTSVEQMSAHGTSVERKGAHGALTERYLNSLPVIYIALTYSLLIPYGEYQSVHAIS